jgi:hypothetical protein
MKVVDYKKACSETKSVFVTGPIDYRRYPLIDKNIIAAYHESKVAIETEFNIQDNINVMLDKHDIIMQIVTELATSGKSKMIEAYNDCEGDF